VHEERRGPSRVAWIVSVLALVCVAVLALGGYAAHWTWTGLSTQVKLWDWFEALALPVTVALTPLLLLHRQHLHRRHKALGAVIVCAFALLVLAGYLVPWTWTGFTGNTLWDWLSLALLPLVIATSTLWRRPERLAPGAVLLLSIGAVVVVALVVAGYLVPWTWTGFTGNTAWDWLQLLLLPVLLPVVVLPSLVERGEAWLAGQGPQGDPAAAADQDRAGRP
jgi:MFS family permease